MARPPSPYQTAQIHKRETGRPILVILAIVAAALGVFLWLQEDQAPTVVAPPPEEPAAIDESQPAAPQVDLDSGLEDWWYDAESAISAAFDAAPEAAEGDCTGLQYALDSVKDMPRRHETGIAVAVSGIEGALGRALGACESENLQVVDGSVTSARQHLRSLIGAARQLELPESSMLSAHI